MYPALAQVPPSPRPPPVPPALTHAEAGARERVGAVAVLSDERHVGALLTAVPTLALEAGPLADHWRKDHLEALAGQRPAPAGAPLARRPPLGPAARAQQQKQRQQPRRPRPRPAHLRAPAASSPTGPGHPRPQDPGARPGGGYGPGARGG